MMDRHTGLVLLYIEPKRIYYARYAKIAGNKARCVNAYTSARHLTGPEVEALRAHPDTVVEDSSGTTAA